MSETETRPGVLKAGGAALWVAAAAAAAVGIARIVQYGAFQDASARACDEVVDLEPSGGWPDSSFPCEQFGPAAWYLPYWSAVAASLVFAALLVAAAIGTARGRRGARTLAAVAAPLGVVLWALPSLFHLGYVFATETANEADSLVAEQVYDHLPTWFGPGESVLEIVFVLAAALALLLLFRPAATAHLGR
ncbi:hypothetical protein GCM10009853_077780 [Glycomyces scopariae]